MKKETKFWHVLLVLGVFIIGIIGIEFENVSGVFIGIFMIALALVLFGIEKMKDKEKK